MREVVCLIRCAMGTMLVEVNDVLGKHARGADGGESASDRAASG